LRDDVLWSYLNAKKFGYDTDSQKEVFEKAQAMTLDDVKAFQEKYIKGLAHTYCILGDTKSLNQKDLNSFGKIQQLNLEELFGY